jgi:hypothetical protein
MKLAIQADRLEIRLNFWERLFSGHPGDVMTILLEHIEAVMPEVPTMHWDEWRAPGIYLPGIFKAGTYYSRQGCEFWYITPQSDHLTLNLRDESFQRVILNVPDSKTLVQAIDHAKQSLAII